MPSAYKVLGQLSPGSNADFNLYTVPAATSAVVSTLAICNRSNTTQFRVAVRPGGATIANTHYLVFDQYIDQLDTLFLTLGITLAATDVVTVSANSTNLTFSMFGTEIT